MMDALTQGLYRLAAVAATKATALPAGRLPVYASDVAII